MAKSNYCREHPVILMRNRIRARKQFDVWGTLGYHIFKPSHADLETISGVLALDLAGLEELNMEEMLGWGQLSMPKMTSNTRWGDPWNNVAGMNVGMLGHLGYLRKQEDKTTALPIDSSWNCFD